MTAREYYEANVRGNHLGSGHYAPYINPTGDLITYVVSVASENEVVAHVVAAGLTVMRREVRGERVGILAG